MLEVTKCQTELNMFSNGNVFGKYHCTVVPSLW